MSQRNDRRLQAVVIACMLIGGCAGDPRSAAKEFAEGGDAYLSAGKLPEAVVEYRNAVQKDPQDGTFRLKLGEAYLRLGDPRKALEECVRAADLLPEDSNARLKAGDLFLLVGRFDDAKLSAEKVLAREPKNVAAQILLATSLAGLKDLDAAIAQIEEAIHLDPQRGTTYGNLGAFELERGRKDAAEAAFKRAIELDSHSARARLALAYFYWTQNRSNDAEQEFLKAAEVEPDNSMAHRAMASFYLATQQPHAAESHLKKVVELTKTPDAAFALADYYTARNDRGAALEVLLPLSKNATTSAAASVRLAIADYQAGRHDEAYGRVGDVLNKDRDQLQALIAKTFFLMADRHLETALETISLAVEKHKDSAAALYWLGRVQAARHQTDAAIAAYDSVLQLNPRATDARVALAQLHLSAGRAETSVGLAKEVVASEPQNLSARLAVVRGLLAQKQLTPAQAELQALVAKQPDSAPVHAQMGVLQTMKQDPVGARRSFERALQLDPASRESLNGLVSLDLQAKRTADARARVDQAVAANADDPTILMIAARTYVTTGDAKRGEELLRQVIEIDSSYFDAYSALGQIYVRQGRLDAALAEFEQLAQRDSKPVVALTFAGMILQARGRMPDARAKFERALQLDPSAAVAANNLAWLYAESGQNLDLALELAQRAAARMPDVAEVNDTIGWVHMKNNLPRAALPYFEKSVRKDGGNALYQYHLGLALAGVGNTTSARLALERAIKLKPDFDGAADAKRILSTTLKLESS